MVYNGSGYGTASQQPKRLDTLKRIKLDDDRQTTAPQEKKISGTAQAIWDVLKESSPPSKAVKMDFNPYLPKKMEPERIIHQDEDVTMTPSAFVPLNSFMKSKTTTFVEDLPSKVPSSFESTSKPTSKPVIDSKESIKSNQPSVDSFKAKEETNSQKSTTFKPIPVNPSFQSMQEDQDKEVAVVPI